MELPIELGIVSDEISPSFEEAVQHGLSWGITRYELRCLQTGRVPAVDAAELDRVEQLVKQHNLRITALSPGMFKHTLSQPSEIEAEIAQTLPATLALATRFSCPLVIVFGFHREEGEPASLYDRMIEYFKRAAMIAQASGVRIAVENEPGFWCDTGAQTLRVIRDVGSPSFGANWDPCNAFGTDEVPYPDGYAAIRDAIINVHVKDTLRGSLIQCVPVGDGVIDWAGQVKALLRDRPVAHMTIETHCHPLIESSRRNVETLRRLITS